MYVVPDEKLCETGLVDGDWILVFNCVILLACELILLSCLSLCPCFRLGNVRCLSELIKDFDFGGLSGPKVPSWGVNNEGCKNELDIGWISEDRGIVDK